MNKRISGRVIIDDLLTFNINTFNWIANAPVWMSTAIKLLNTHYAQDIHTLDIEVVDGKAVFPFDVESIMAVRYGSIKCDRITHVSGLYNNNTTSIGYIVKFDNSIEIELESGIISVTYKGYPYIYEELDKQYYPLIVDGERMKEYLRWYVFFRLLASGVKHPIYALGNRNPDYDPYQLYLKCKTGAINDCNKIDTEQRRTLSDAATTFVLPQDATESLII